MAYMNQETKAKLAPAIKAVLKKYSMKGTLGVRHHSSLVLNIKEGRLDLLGNAQKHNDMVAERRGQQSYPVGTYLQVNEYHAASWARETGNEEIANFYEEIKAAMEGPDFFNEDDAMTDYFYRSHYIDINVGQWNKPYIFTGEKETV